MRESTHNQIYSPLTLTNLACHHFQYYHYDSRPMRLGWIKWTMKKISNFARKSNAGMNVWQHFCYFLSALCECMLCVYFLCVRGGHPWVLNEYQFRPGTHTYTHYSYITSRDHSNSYSDYKICLGQFERRFCGLCVAFIHIRSRELGMSHSQSAWNKEWKKHSYEQAAKGKWRLFGLGLEEIES